MNIAKAASATKEGATASRRVSRGIMRALESGDLLPGQRLVEADLAADYEVGRNAVREAIQWLAAQGTIAIHRFRSAAIRRFDRDEALEVLDVTASFFGLMARAAARHYRPERHAPLLHDALAEIESAEIPGAFGRGRRHFYRALLEIGGNRELQRLFPSLGIHILYAQYRSTGPQRPRLEDFRAMRAAISRNDADQAEAAARIHIEMIRAAIPAPRP